MSPLNNSSQNPASYTVQYDVTAPADSIHYLDAPKELRKAQFNYRFVTIPPPRKRTRPSLPTENNPSLPTKKNAPSPPPLAKRARIQFDYAQVESGTSEIMDLIKGQHE